jgi:hypothetical protein
MIRIIPVPGRDFSDCKVQFSDSSKLHFANASGTSFGSPPGVYARQTAVSALALFLLKNFKLSSFNDRRRPKICDWD